MNSHSPYSREGNCLQPVVPRRLRRWSRCVGVLFAAGTFVSLLASAEWKLGMVLADPLAWMMLILAAATGVTAGYALGCRLSERRAA